MASVSDRLSSLEQAAATQGSGCAAICWANGQDLPTGTLFYHKFLLTKGGKNATEIQVRDDQFPSFSVSQRKKNPSEIFPGHLCGVVEGTLW